MSRSATYANLIRQFLSVYRQFVPTKKSYYIYIHRELTLTLMLYPEAYWLQFQEVAILSPAVPLCCLCWLQ